MQTVNFKCGHCGNLMGVGAEYLGQQVRCPHCQQVVVAPAAPPSPAPPSHLDETTVLPPSPDDASIFTEDGPTDSLFDEPKPPPLDLLAPPRETTLPLEPRPVSAPAPALDSTLAIPPEPAALASTFAEVPPPSLDMPDWMKTTATPPAATSANGSAIELPAPPPIKAPRQSSLGMLLFISLVFMPLVLYSILVTIVAILVYNKSAPSDAPPDPRELLNDNEGDHPGAKKNKTTSYYKVDIKKATEPLPDKLRIKLGDTVEFGQLRVKAERVELGTVKMTLAGGGGKAEERQAFILRLHLENISADTSFYPMDAYFNRQWDGKTPPVPFTMLVADEKLRFIGGPAHWKARGQVLKSDHSAARYDVVGTHCETELKPGEVMDTFVCTDGFDPTRDSPQEEKKFKEVLDHQGKLLWQVQVRRGLFHWKDHDYPTTAVFGVEFTADDIHQPD